MTGAVNNNGLRHFLFDFFELNTGETLHVVILNSTVPSADVEEIITDPTYETMVTYLEGSILNAKDLQRCAALAAEAVFFIGNKFSRAPDDEDAVMILRYLSLKRCQRATASRNHSEP